ncbi:hypothetical protein AVP_27 [Aerococcus phage vB_AviM_AVP]|nr:hypothetical protein AVP_27 [Aerococcus phage vB_AviM_AVP]
MNTQDEIKELKKRIAELEEQTKKEREFPQYLDTYWIIEDSTEVSTYVWEGDDFDNQHLPIGNVFKTEEQAKFTIEKLKVEAELRKYSDSWDLEKTQYTFSFNWEFGAFEVEYPDYNQYPDSYYFDSINSLQLALETVGEERIKKYIFGVKG